MPTLTEIREDYSGQIYDLERGTAAELTGTLSDQVAAIHRFALAEWVKRFGSTDNAPSASELRSLIAAIKRRFGNLSFLDLEALLDSMGDAAALGVAQNLDELDAQRLTAAEKRGMKAAAASAVVLGDELNPEGINTTAEEKLADIAKLLAVKNITDWGSLFRILSGLNAMLLEMDRSITTVINAAASLGAVHVAREVGGQLMWVSERDACLHCLAYAGQIVDPGEEFEGGRTFGDKPLSEAPLKGPPLHPYCRCRLSVWLGSREGVGDVEAPEALEREAWRTVLRGWSPYASEPARIRAADRLLDNLPGQMPKSVQEYARQAIKRGYFKQPAENPLRD